MKISVVIAAFNEAENIGPLTSRLISTLDSFEDSKWELIFIIDGTDDTMSIATTFASDRPEIRILHSVEPRGLANAFRRGFNAVTDESDVVVTMDADLNHQPEEIPRLVNALFRRDAGIVVGSRKVQGSATTGAPVWKTTLSSIVNRFMRRLAGMPVADMTSGFRAYSRNAFRRISFESAGFAFLPEILMLAHAAGVRIVEEPIQFIFRVTGRSKMKLMPTTLSYLRLFAARLFAIGKTFFARIRWASAGSGRD
jgi:dolichol-phosphate mannosyltransferase